MPFIQEPGEPESGTLDTGAPIDTSKASIARVYDAFLSGKDNYEVDRAVVQETLKIVPGAQRSAQLLRAWLIRACRFLAGTAGMDQFLDCGSGLPTAENVHQVTQRLNPDAKVVYVDNDPIVAAHGRALLTENPNTRFAVADLREPESVLTHPTVTEHLDLTRPYALMHCATIHHVDDADRPNDIMRSYIDALPSGSYLALSHFFDPDDGGELSKTARLAEETFRNSSMGTGRFRTKAQIESFFDGMELVEPGIVEAVNWWPDGPRLHEPAVSDLLLVAGVARKP